MCFILNWPNLVLKTLINRLFRKGELNVMVENIVDELNSFTLKCVWSDRIDSKLTGKI